MVRGSEKLRIEFERTSFMQRSQGDFIFRPYTKFELVDLRLKMMIKAEKEKGQKRKLLMNIANDMAILLQYSK